jgi:hypothetical protein
VENRVKKEERFKRVASKRVQNILEGIKSLSKCSNTNNYYYEEEEINKMLRAIKEELKIMEIMYKKNFSNRERDFEF